MADTVFVGTYEYSFDDHPKRTSIPPRRTLDLAQSHLGEAGDIQYIFEYDLDTGKVVRSWARVETADGRGGWIWSEWRERSGA